MERHIVLHVVTHLIHGGTEFYVLRQVAGLDPNRISAHVTFISSRNDIGHLYEAAGVAPTSMEHRNFLDAPRTLWRLIALIRRENINVVQTHSRHDRVYGHAAAWLTRVPVVDTVHSEFGAMRHEAERQNPSLKALLRVRLEDVLRARVVREVIAVSASVADVWERNGSKHDPVDRVSVVGPTVDFGSHRPGGDDSGATRTQLGIGDADPVLVSVGRLIESKNHKLLVPVMQEVVKRYPTAVLLLVGSGELLGELTALVERAGLTENMRLLGSRDDISDLLAASDLFVFPSLTEGLGVAALEAAASGLPLVTFDLPSLREIVQDGVNGIRAQPVGDAAAFTRSMLSALENLSTFQLAAVHVWWELRERFDTTASANDDLERIYASARSS